MRPEEETWARRARRLAQLRRPRHQLPLLHQPGARPAPPLDRPLQLRHRPARLLRLLRLVCVPDFVRLRLRLRLWRLHLLYQRRHPLACGAGPPPELQNFQGAAAARAETWENGMRRQEEEYGGT